MHKRSMLWFQKKMEKNATRYGNRLKNVEKKWEKCQKMYKLKLKYDKNLFTFYKKYAIIKTPSIGTVERAKMSSKR